MSATLSNATSNGGSVLGATRGPSVATGGSALMPNLSSSAALFREIHKNTWLKRLTADGKRITVGPKKSERSWVVFCVHDDSQALLEGYAEPRQAASHNPEWVVSMQETQHISHALIPNSHEFEFVVTLSTEVVRFHTTSWEVMQEWVETLRSKLREMKILSPRENLYTKLPEIRAPLLPTRDPTSPLPAPPPVPAALVPGIERVVPQGVVHAADATAANSGTSSGGTGTVSTSNVSTSGSASVATSQSALNLPTAFASHIPNTPAVSSMSNTLTQNLLNMLSDPIIAYSEQLQEEDLAEATHLSDVETNSELSSGCNLNGSPSDTCMAIMQDFSDEMPAVNENSVRLDIGTTIPDQSGKFSEFMHCGRLGSRPQTSRSFSAGAADSAQRQLTKKPTIAQHLSTGARSAANGNITELEIISAHCGTTANTETSLTDSVDPSAPTDTATNITIIQVTNDAGNQPQSRNCLSKADVFKFPEEADITSITPHNTKAEDFFRSNVQIIPSSVNSSTIRVIDGSKAFAAVVANQYSAPTKNPPQTSHSVPADSHAIVSTAIPSPRSHLENHQITTVHVGNATMPSGVASLYGTCYTATEGPQQAASAPILPNKIILSANSSGVTNISVNSTEDNSESVLLNRSAADSNVRHIADSFRYEKVFLSSSIPVAASQRRSEEAMAVEAKVPMSPKLSLPQQIAESAKLSKSNSTTASSSSLPSSPTSAAALLALAVRRQKPSYKPSKQTPEKNSSHSQSETGSSSQRVKATLRLDSSPVMQRKHTLNALVAPGPSIPTRAKFLTRGLTEAVITARPSRKDLCSPRSSVKPKVENNSSDNRTAATNNNEEATTSTSNSYETPQFDAGNRTRSGSLEQRKRSSSTSETHAHRTRATNNNELTSRAGSSAMRMQPPPHPISQPSVSAAPAATKRLTLREQQVMQLRREIMHPGGVRLQLRRKDCIGSIAWVDAFGAVWVAGWKQKEHPVLYNALHIGDQLVSIAGVTVSSAADANKVIRNSNTLFIEVLIRRIPFGRGYAIRREREGQCLGLIRDGNTSTIVDVVPNSLAARHGLPPKAQSCDGSTLTFWVLTEINARPLNLFFKENEIRDRLNSVGRDISILVQPSDLIVKLKKQLKSMRGYKDYLVQ